MKPYVLTNLHNSGKGISLFFNLSVFKSAEVYTRTWYVHLCYKELFVHTRAHFVTDTRIK